MLTTFTMNKGKADKGKISFAIKSRLLKPLVQYSDEESTEASDNNPALSGGKDTKGTEEGQPLLKPEEKSLIDTALLREKVIKKKRKNEVAIGSIKPGKKEKGHLRKASFVFSKDEKGVSRLYDSDEETPIVDPVVLREKMMSHARQQAEQLAADSDRPQPNIPLPTESEGPLLNIPLPPEEKKEKPEGAKAEGSVEAHKAHDRFREKSKERRRSRERSRDKKSRDRKSRDRSKERKDHKSRDRKSRDRSRDRKSRDRRSQDKSKDRRSRDRSRDRRSRSRDRRSNERSRRRRSRDRSRDRSRSRDRHRKSRDRSRERRRSRGKSKESKQERLKEKFYSWRAFT